MPEAPLTRRATGRGADAMGCMLPADLPAPSGARGSQLPNPGVRPGTWPVPAGDPPRVRPAADPASYPIRSGGQRAMAPWWSRPTAEGAELGPERDGEGVG